MASVFLAVDRQYRSIALYMECSKYSVEENVDRYETWNFKSTKHYETVKDGPEVDSTNCVVLHKKIYS